MTLPPSDRPILCEGAMHTYIPGDGTTAVASSTTRRFQCAEDVVALAMLDPRIGRATWPEIWHLDERGSITCCLRGCCGDSFLGWARDPWALRQLREEGVDLGHCGTDWLIVESRPGAEGSARPAVTRVDVEAYTLLRSELHDVGVRLVDVVVFDDCGHWWSLREMADGTTLWSEGPENQTYKLGG
jgi:hypothetical protein